MYQEIDPKRQAVVDRTTMEAIPGAVAAEPESGWVRVRQPTYDGEKFIDVWRPEGVRIVRYR